MTESIAVIQSETKKLCMVATMRSAINESDQIQDDFITILDIGKEEYLVTSDGTFPIAEYVMSPLKSGISTLPVIRCGSDYKWQIAVLKSCLANPEEYDNPAEAVGKSLKWLREHVAQATTSELKELYKIVHSLKQ